MDSGGDTPATTTTVNYTPEERAARSKVMGEAQSIYDAQKPKLNTMGYPGAAPVGFDQYTLAAQDLAVQNAGNAQTNIADINRGVSYGLNGAMDVNSNPWLTKAVQGAIRPITESYTDTGGVMSQIRDGAQGAGQFGSSRQGIAEGIAAGRYADAVGDVSSRMYSDAYNKGQDTFARTLAFAPQAMDASMQPVNWLSGVGAQNEGLAQAQAQYDADSKMWDLNKDWAGLNNLANIIYGGGSGQSVTTGTPAQAGSSWASGALGGAMAGAQFGPWGAAAGGLLGAFL